MKMSRHSFTFACIVNNFSTKIRNTTKIALKMFISLTFMEIQLLIMSPNPLGTPKNSLTF